MAGQDLYRHVTESCTIGWQPGCGCRGECTCEDSWEDKWEGHDAGCYYNEVLLCDPCTVFDPFCGSGTVGVVAKQLGRNFIGIELNSNYCEMARQRIANPEPEPEVQDVPGQLKMFEEVGCEPT